MPPLTRSGAAVVSGQSRGIIPVRGSWSPAHANLHVLSAAPLGSVLLLGTQRREGRLTLWHSLIF